MGLENDVGNVDATTGLLWSDSRVETSDVDTTI
jgi:hypothetical protein